MQGFATPDIPTACCLLGRQHFSFWLLPVISQALQVSAVVLSKTSYFCGTLFYLCCEHSVFTAFSAVWHDWPRFESPSHLFPMVMFPRNIHLNINLFLENQNVCSLFCFLGKHISEKYELI